jgi:uncharacterized surface protein with fasciclin (FAS1) repeats
MRRFRNSSIFALVLALGLLVAACGDDDATTTTATTMAPASDIVDTAVAAGDFTTLVAAVEAAGLAETLKGDGPFTVFAPTDAAFAALPEGTVEALLEDIPTLTEILLYHVAGAAVPASDVVGLDTVTTLQGGELPVMVEGDTVTIDAATVITTDIEASNGIIHVIDAVLLP